MAVLKNRTRLRLCAAPLMALAGTAAAGVPTLVINDVLSVPLQSPSQYVGLGAGQSQLSVSADGFVLCANVDAGGGIVPGAITLAPLLGPWALPTAVDVRALAFVGGTLSINAGASLGLLPTTLTCQVRDVDGRVASPFSTTGNFIFVDGFDVGLDILQRTYLVNWVPDTSLGFDWPGVNSPDWKQAPNDSCTWGTNPNTALTDVPQVSEASLCAAATGVRPVGTTSQNDTRYGDRSLTMWTSSTTVGNQFVYIARIDTRLGAQPPGDLPNSHFLNMGPNAPLASVVDVAIRDAYDGNYLMAGGTYCLRNELPTPVPGQPLQIPDNVCAAGDPHVYYTGTLPAADGGILSERVSLIPAAKAQSLFVVVMRQKKPGGVIGSCRPAAAIAVLPSPDVSINEAGDSFIGDDVVYGFRNTDSFEWMGCTP